MGIGDVSIYPTKAQWVSHTEPPAKWDQDKGFRDITHVSLTDHREQGRVKVPCYCV